MRFLSMVGLVAACVLVSACGDQSGSRQPAATSGATNPSTGVSGDVIEMTTDNTFSPNALTIARGTTVTFSNPSSMPHNVVADTAKATSTSPSSVPDGAEPFTSPMLMKGDTWSHTFDVPGVYAYYCQPHAALGMVGTITVTE